MGHNRKRAVTSIMAFTIRNLLHTAKQGLRAIMYLSWGQGVQVKELDTCWHSSWEPLASSCYLIQWCSVPLCLQFV